MATTPKVAHSASMAIVPYQPRQTSREFLRSETEKITNEVFRRTLEQAKYATNIFPNKRSNFRNPKCFQITKASLSPPKDLKTDSRIGIEIFASTPRDPKSPIVIFSHGYGEPSRNYSRLLGELASHGYTVLSLTHPASVKEIPGVPREKENALMDKLAGIMAKNIQYVVGQVRDGSLQHLGASNKIILIGHSLGGAASIIASRANNNILGCVNLDGSLCGNAKTDGLTQPLLMIIGDHEGWTSELEQHPDKQLQKEGKASRMFLNEYDILRDNSEHSEKIVIPRATHMDFTDESFRDYSVQEKGKTLSTAIRVHALATRKVLEFLDKY